MDSARREKDDSNNSIHTFDSAYDFMLRGTLSVAQEVRANEKNDYYSIDGDNAYRVRTDRD